MNFETYGRVERIHNLTLVNADCMQILKDLPDNYYDLACVDPPYGIVGTQKRGNGGRFNLGKGKIHNVSWNDKKPSANYWLELFRVSKEQIVWGANNFELPPTEYFLVWAKKQTVDNFSSAEYAWVSMNEWKKTAKVFVYGIHKEMAERKKKGKIHQAQKPVKLYEWLLTNYAKPDQKILDTHLGSGSSAIAAHYFGCDFTGIEIDKDYFDASISRITEQTRQMDLLG